jgi:radical SAM superfamily enzyme YgiQ (UPF0313 family)
LNVLTSDLPKKSRTTVRYTFKLFLDGSYYQPDIVGVTGYSMHVLRNLAICSRVKELCPGCKTVVGGHHATLLPEDFFEPQIDFVVVGEGAAPFRSILAAQQGKSQALSIPGVWALGHLNPKPQSV